MAIWAYHESVDDDINVVITDVTAKLNLLLVDQSATAKVALSNQSHGAARGLIVWAADFDSVPSVATGTNWARYTWHTDHEYASMYDSLIGSLNQQKLPDGQTLSPAQAFYALLTMSNQRHGEAALSLFWRL